MNQTQTGTMKRKDNMTTLEKEIIDIIYAWYQKTLACEEWSSETNPIPVKEIMKAVRSYFINIFFQGDK
jgi:hypothetical protein